MALAVPKLLVAGSKSASAKTTPMSTPTTPRRRGLGKPSGRRWLRVVLAHALPMGFPPRRFRFLRRLSCVPELKISLCRHSTHSGSALEPSPVTIMGFVGNAGALARATSEAVSVSRVGMNSSSLVQQPYDSV